MNATDAAGRDVTPDVAVVGSLNLDLVLPVPRTPSRGETVIAGTRRQVLGGKGANQAVGCARLGLNVAILGAVGDDEGGRELRARLGSEGVDTTRLHTLDVDTGLAVVIVEDGGESTIVVSPGANGALGPTQVEAAQDLLAGAGALLCQLEVPTDAIARACELAQGLVVVNPAPARQLPPALLGRVDVLVPNRFELATLAGDTTATTLTAIEDQARSLWRAGGPDAVVVTLGSDGALVVADGHADHVPAVPAEVVDTTAAGDSFCAGLVRGLLHGRHLHAAVEEATVLAALTTSRHGAMDALPHRHDPAVARILD
jgi:ribokinase